MINVLIYSPLDNFRSLPKSGDEMRNIWFYYISARVRGIISNLVTVPTRLFMEEADDGLTLSDKTLM